MLCIDIDIISDSHLTNCLHIDVLYIDFKFRFTLDELFTSLNVGEDVSSWNAEVMYIIKLPHEHTSNLLCLCIHV
jgi:hypothetical protein